MFFGEDALSFANVAFICSIIVALLAIVFPFCLLLSLSSVFSFFVVVSFPCETGNDLSRRILLIPCALIKWLTSSSAFLLKSVSGFAFVFDNMSVLSDVFGVSLTFFATSRRLRSSVSFFPVKARISITNFISYLQYLALNLTHICFNLLLHI